MMWSVDLHVVALLDLYLGPMSEVTELVRGQLLQEQEAESIRQAIEDFAKGTSTPETLYGHYLSYSGLDFSARQEALVSIVVSGELHRALFDLTLGQRVRSLQMSLYTEVHNAREMVQHFFAEFEDDTVRGAGEKLWWDEIHNDGTVHEPWLAQNLRNDVNFLPILHSWLDDSGRLQLWLDSQLEESIVVNNPNSERPVVSYSSAVAIIEFAKVRCLCVFTHAMQTLTPAFSIAPREPF
jgi:hypothetical protein